MKTINIIKFKQLYWEGLSDCKIAKILGCTPSGVNYHRKRLGLVANIAPRLDRDELLLHHADTMKMANAYHRQRNFFNRLKERNPIKYQKLMDFIAQEEAQLQQQPGEHGEGFSRLHEQPCAELQLLSAERQGMGVALTGDTLDTADNINEVKHA